MAKLSVTSKAVKPGIYNFHPSTRIEVFFGRISVIHIISGLTNVHFCITQILMIVYCG